MRQLKVVNRTIAALVPRNYMINTCGIRVRKLQRFINGFPTNSAHRFRGQYLLTIRNELRVLRAVFFFTHAVYSFCLVPRGISSAGRVYFNAAPWQKGQYKKTTSSWMPSSCQIIRGCTLCQKQFLPLNHAKYKCDSTVKQVFFEKRFKNNVECNNSRLIVCFPPSCRCSI